MRLFSFALISLAMSVGISAALAGETAAVPVKDWTLMVFMNGHHDDLAPYTDADLNEMESVGSNDRMNIVVQWAKAGQAKTKRLYITKDANPKVVTSKVVQELPRADMGDYRALIDFISWSVARYPAKHYFIVVWNHGGGWNLRTLGFQTRDISSDPYTGHVITTAQLGAAMREAGRMIGHPVDIYGSDACLMQMAEVAAEMADSVRVVVGSEESEPMEGWPYDRLPERWNAISGADAREVASLLVEEYVKSYQGGSQGEKEVTFSAIDSSKMAKFSGSVQALGRELGKLEPAVLEQVRDAMNGTTRFSGAGGDFGEFLSALENQKVPGLSSSVFSDARSALQELVFANASTAGYSGVTGVSMWMPVYAPSSDQLTKYRKLAFDSKTDWAAFLTKINP